MSVSSCYLLRLLFSYNKATKTFVDLPAYAYVFCSKQKHQVFLFLFLQRFQYGVARGCEKIIHGLRIALTAIGQMQVLPT